MDTTLYHAIVRTLATGQIPDNLSPELKRIVPKVADLYTLVETTLYIKDESRNGTLETLDSRGRQH